MLNWIRSFLKGRTQCVRVEGEMSEWKSVINGILQVSVLGQIPFAIYINDLPNEVKFNMCKLFDDSKV